jgi:hypothetical protein
MPLASFEHPQQQAEEFPVPLLHPLRLRLVWVEERPLPMEAMLEEVEVVD